MYDRHDNGVRWMTSMRHATRKLTTTLLECARWPMTAGTAAHDAPVGALGQPQWAAQPSQLTNTTLAFLVFFASVHVCMCVYVLPCPLGVSALHTPHLLVALPRQLFPSGTARIGATVSILFGRPGKKK